MPDFIDQVHVTANVNLRQAGNTKAPIVASVRKGMIFHVTGKANKAGFAPGYVFGHKPAGEDVLLSDSLRGVGVNALLFPGAHFEPTGPTDEYNRTPGKVAGYISMLWTRPTVPTDELVDA